MVKSAPSGGSDSCVRSSAASLYARQLTHRHNRSAARRFLPSLASVVAASCRSPHNWSRAALIMNASVLLDRAFRLLKMLWSGLTPDVLFQLPHSSSVLKP